MYVHLVIFNTIRNRLYLHDCTHEYAHGIKKKIIFIRSVDFIYEHTQLNVFRMNILLSVVTILMLRNCCV